MHSREIPKETLKPSVGPSKRSCKKSGNRRKMVDPSPPRYDEVFFRGRMARPARLKPIIGGSPEKNPGRFFDKTRDIQAAFDRVPGLYIEIALPECRKRKDKRNGQSNSVKSKATSPRRRFFARCLRDFGLSFSIATTTSTRRREAIKESSSPGRVDREEDKADEMKGRADQGRLVHRGSGGPALSARGTRSARHRDLRFRDPEGGIHEGRSCGLIFEPVKRAAFRPPLTMSTSGKLFVQCVCSSDISVFPSDR